MEADSTAMRYHRPSINISGPSRSPFGAEFFSGRTGAKRGDRHPQDHAIVPYILLLFLLPKTILSIRLQRK